jgi:hypothetical protein
LLNVEMCKYPTANSQYPICPPSLNNGYWILDTGYLHIFTFPSPPTQSFPLRQGYGGQDGGQVDSCKGFHGLLLTVN